MIDRITEEKIDRYLSITNEALNKLKVAARQVLQQKAGR